MCACVCACVCMCSYVRMLYALVLRDDRRETVFIAWAFVVSQPAVRIVSHPTFASVRVRSKPHRQM